KQIPDEVIRQMRAAGFEATTDFSRLAEADAVLICVPTPLTDAREPDLSYVVQSAEAVARYLRPGQLVVLGSTTYPTTTRGAGLGGHCIPIVPFYLTWVARKYGLTTRFIELAGEVNAAMPAYVVGRVADALNEFGKPVRGSKVLLLGMAYKKDVDDPREAPGF